MNLEWNQRSNIGLQYLMNQLSPGSAYGQKALGRLRPFGPADRHLLQETLDNVERTLNAQRTMEREYARLAHLLMGIKDLHQTLETAKVSVLSEIELYELKRYLIQLEELGQLFSRITAVAGYTGITLADTKEALDILDIERNRVATFYISSRFSEPLAAIRIEKKALEDRMRLTKDENELAYLKQQRQKAAAAEQEQEAEARHSLTRQLRPHLDAMTANTVAIERLDLLLQRAALAEKGQTVKPDIGTDDLSFTGMTNPMIDDYLIERKQRFTPVDIALSEGTTVITGANMSGKSVALKTIALNVWLAHSGFYCFAQTASVPLFDEMFLVSEDLEAADRGLSSFGGEICRINDIIGAVRVSRCLVLLDEFARGTNPREGAALARAIAEYFNSKKVVAVMTTHYDGVAAAAERHYQMRGLRGWKVDPKIIASLSDREKVDLIAHNMNYGLLKADRKDAVAQEALTICKLLNIDREVIEKANFILTSDKEVVELE